MGLRASIPRSILATPSIWSHWERSGGVAVAGLSMWSIAFTRSTRARFPNRRFGMRARTLSRGSTSRWIPMPPGAITTASRGRSMVTCWSGMPLASGVRVPRTRHVWTVKRVRSSPDRPVLSPIPRRMILSTSRSAATARTCCAGRILQTQVSKPSTAGFRSRAISTSRHRRTADWPPGKS